MCLIRWRRINRYTKEYMIENSYETKSFLGSQTGTSWQDGDALVASLPASGLNINLLQSWLLSNRTRDNFRSDSWVLFSVIHRDSIQLSDYIGFDAIVSLLSIKLKFRTSNANCWCICMCVCHMQQNIWSLIMIIFYVWFDFIARILSWCIR